MDIVYQQVVGIVRRLEGMLAREIGEREAKRFRESRTYSGTRAPAVAHHGRGYVSRPVHSTLPAASVPFFGHVVSSDGIKVDSKKVEPVQSWPKPSLAKEIRSFFGLAGHYRRFVGGFSSIAAPLFRP
uniref:Uncharacterized protein LOC104213875 n=1 Tax=Nicotiana sylvestris TaxID=4096 RepID=A0A1U7V9S7_NICSY|nr:PREDICTED: uncharacterized protein LOC104213875 [Nicotiana sylvestris]